MSADVQADLSIGEPGEPEVEAAPPDAEYVPLEDVDVVAAPVTETQVRDIIDGLGRAASVAASFEVPGLWRFSDDELDGLVPPLTRIINKRPALQRAVAKGDEIAVALQLSAYLGRRVDTITEVRRQRQEDDNANGQREAHGDDARGDAEAGGVSGLGWPVGTYGGGDAPPVD